jgi:hypothetical protein
MFVRSIGVYYCSGERHGHSVQSRTDQDHAKHLVLIQPALARVDAATLPPDTNSSTSFARSLLFR